jgi:hypothetical protein
VFAGAWFYRMINSRRPLEEDGFWHHLRHRLVKSNMPSIVTRWCSASAWATCDHPAELRDRR